jgi:hypothetical protein
MTEAGFHTAVTWAEIGLAVVTWISLTVVVAPYGRHDREGWGPALPNAAGWVTMELPAVVAFAVIYLRGRHAYEVVPLLFAGLWMVHYVYRTFVFPFRLRTRGKSMRVVVVGLGFTFNVLNAYVVGRWISHLGTYGPEWLRDPRFLLGVALFVTGLWVNHDADRTLIGLREGGGTGYRVPSGGLFDRIASPNYFGEIVEWTGFAVATWSLPGLAFALFTAANLAPRAASHRRWYAATFPEYPQRRKALIPYLW